MYLTEQEQHRAINAYLKGKNVGYYNFGPLYTDGSMTFYWGRGERVYTKTLTKKQIDKLKRDENAN